MSHQILPTKSCQRCIHYRAPPSPPPAPTQPPTNTAPPPAAQCLRFIVVDSVTNRTYYMETAAARVSSPAFCGEDGRYFVPYFPPECNDKRQL